MNVATRKPLADCRLYTFVDFAYLDGRDPRELARQLCEGGSDLVQLRAKGQSAAEIRKWAELLLPIVESFGAWFVVNDHAEIAQSIGAPLCHLGQEDFFASGLQCVENLFPATDVGPSLPGVGLSSHAPDQADRAVKSGAAYVAVGPVFATPTKRGRTPVTLEYVRWARDHLNCPWFAIGGINLQTLPDVLRAGAQRVCVVSAILRSTTIAVTCREFRRRLDDGGSPSH